MSDIYVFSPNEEDNDYSSMGLAGALEPTEATFKETLNGESTVTLKHPLDEFGAYLNLTEGNILAVPVPVRSTPEIQNGKVVTTVFTYEVKPLAQLTSKSQRTLYKKKKGSGKKKILNAGETVTVVEKSEKDGERWKVKSQYGEGWINVASAEEGPEGFTYKTKHEIADNSQSIEEVQSPWSVMPQYFRINKVKKNMDGYEVEARHISYDLLYNATIYESKSEVTLQTALDGVLKGCIGVSEDEQSFKAYTNVENTQAGLFYRVRNPIDIFLNEDDGLCKKYDVCLVRDNYSLYFLHDPGLNRGVRIQYGKNMVGIDFETNTDELATRIVPIGETKDGENLYLLDKDEKTGKFKENDTYKTIYVDSTKIDNYPFPHVYELKCDDCKIGDSDSSGGTIDKKIARARMKAQAEKEFENRCDEPKISMSVEFINLGDTEEYSQFKDLENCFLADYVIVQHPDLNIDVTARISEIEWDCLLNRMNSVTIGEVGKTLANTGITSWQIPSGISGSKIADGTLGNSALKQNIINAIHMQAESVNTNALAANSVTAQKLNVNEIMSSSIVTDALNAQSIEAIKGKFETIVSEKLTTDEFYAAFAEISALTAKTADFDQATVQHLIASALNLQFGEAGTVYITNLAVRYAQLMHATIADLCIKASDGNYYTLDVNQNGNVTASKSNVTQGEISIGQTNGQKFILETNMTVENLNTSNLLGTYALINKIDAAKIDVGELFAREAFITLLRTSRIVGDKSITLIAEQSEQASRCFRQNEEPTGTNGAKAGDIWIQPDTGGTYQAESAEDAKLKFAIGRDGSLYFTAEDETISFTMDDFDLFFSDDVEIRLSENPDGTLTTPFRWVLVQDESMLEDIKSNKDYLDRVIRVDSDGLHVGDSQTDNEVLIDSDSVNVVIDGKKYSKFADRYVQFGNYRLGLADDNGLMFKPL